MRMSDSGRVLPSLTPISEPFFAAARKAARIQHLVGDGDAAACDPAPLAAVAAKCVPPWVVCPITMEARL